MADAKMPKAPGAGVLTQAHGQTPTFTFFAIESKAPNMGYSTIYISTVLVKYALFA
jgi:hypothetical protein